MGGVLSSFPGESQIVNDAATLNGQAIWTPCRIILPALGTEGLHIELDNTVRTILLKVPQGNGACYTFSDAQALVTHVAGTPGAVTDVGPGAMVCTLSGTMTLCAKSTPVITITNIDGASEISVTCNLDLYGSDGIVDIMKNTPVSEAVFEAYSGILIAVDTPGSAGDTSTFTLTGDGTFANGALSGYGGHPTVWSSPKPGGWDEIVVPRGLVTGNNADDPIYFHINSLGGQEVAYLLKG